MNIFCAFESFETIGDTYWDGDERHTRMNFHPEKDSSILLSCISVLKPFYDLIFLTPFIKLYSLCCKHKEPQQLTASYIPTV